MTPESIRHVKKYYIKLVFGNTRKRDHFLKLIRPYENHSGFAFINDWMFNLHQSPMTMYQQYFASESLKSTNIKQRNIFKIYSLDWKKLDTIELLLNLGFTPIQAVKNVLHISFEEDI